MSHKYNQSVTDYFTTKSYVKNKDVFTEIHIQSITNHSTTKSYTKNKDIFTKTHIQSVTDYSMTKSYVKNKNVFTEAHNQSVTDYLTKVWDKQKFTQNANTTKLSEGIFNKVMKYE